MSDQEFTEESFHPEGFVLVRRRGPVAHVVLNRPEKLNALFGDMGPCIRRAFEALDEEDNVKVIRFQGEGRAFSTGGDMNWIGTQYTTPEDSEAKRRPSQRHRLGRDDRQYRTFEAILNSSKVVIGEGRSFVLGVALDLFLASDITILTDDCVLGYPPARMIAASGVSTLYWMLRMGPALHAEITMMGRNIKAEEALERGLVNRVVPADQFESTIEAAVESVLAIPTDGLAISKFNKRVAWDLLGVRASKLQSAIGHAMQVQQRMEKDDWNLIRERQAGGARGAISSRDERFRDALLRFNPGSANL